MSETRKQNKKKGEKNRVRNQRNAEGESLFVGRKEGRKIKGRERERKIKKKEGGGG